MTLASRPQPLSVEAFEALLGFPMDPFQRDAIEAYAAGHSVLAAAPTGTGKTAIAEYAALDSLARGGRALYTTPIKALSNQKFRDFQELLERAAERGLVPEDADAGLLTGDLVVNSDARLLVMTTEVLRNMLVQGRTTPEEAGVIVFDEVHYMGDPERGTAWEESILLSPPSVPFVCLSATVPNADELADWIRAAHGDLTCVFHEERAVPLEHRYFVDGKAHLVVDAGGRKRASFKGVGGELARNISRPGAWGAPEPARSADADEDDEDGRESGPGGPRAGGRERARKVEPKRQAAPWEVLRTLEAEQLTPAIYFLFSRRACEEAAMACVALPPVPWGMDLVREAKIRLAELPPEDRALRQVALLFRLLPRGIAVHHAGMLPVVKMLVEDLFQSGRLRAVFATDTLALGINMPARTVVVGEMSKWDGQQHRLLTPNEYRQMTGRAGRRGIDQRGVSVVLYSPWVSFERSLAIMTGDLLPLESAFSPSYSTALNLWREPGDQERLADLYARSFRRFQRTNRMEALTDERDELKATFEQQATRAAADPDTWEMARELAQTEKAIARAHQEVRVESRALVSGIGQVLERFGYLANERPTFKASLLRSVFDTNALVLGELIFGRYLEGLEPAEVAEVCAWFAFDRDAPYRGLPLTRRVYRLREDVLGLQTRIMDEERRARVTISRPINEDLKGAALAWAEGEELGEIASRARLAEGDLVGLLQKTIDIMNQLRAALDRLEMPPRRMDRIDRDGLIEALVEGDALLRRGVVEASYRWALDGPPDADDDAAADWTPPSPEDDGDARPARRPQRANRGGPGPRRQQGGSASRTQGGPGPRGQGGPGGPRSNGSGSSGGPSRPGRPPGRGGPKGPGGRGRGRPPRGSR